MGRKMYGRYGGGGTRELLASGRAVGAGGALPGAGGEEFAGVDGEESAGASGALPGAACGELAGAGGEELAGAALGDSGACA
jgi:hypothetical protein